MPWGQERLHAYNPGKTERFLRRDRLQDRLHDGEQRQEGEGQDRRCATQGGKVKGVNGLRQEGAASHAVKPRYSATAVKA